MWNARFFTSWALLAFPALSLATRPWLSDISNHFSFLTYPNLPCLFNFAFATYPKCSSCPSTRLSFTLFSKSSSGVPPRPEKLPCLPLLFIPPSSVPWVFFCKTIILIVGLYWPSTTCTRPWARHLTWTYLSLTTILETDYYHVNFTEEEV